MNAINGIQMRCGKVIRVGDRLTSPILAGSVVILPHFFDVFDQNNNFSHSGSSCDPSYQTIEEFLYERLGTRFGNGQIDEWWD